MTSNSLHRRNFLKHSSLAGAALVTASGVLPALAIARERSPGANDRVGIGYIGCGRRGGQLRELPANAEVVGVADCNIQRAELWAQQYDCDAYQDYRELLERPDLDGVIVASPDHWHALHSIHAAMAGKDVYCEKPINLTIAEGQAMVKAVRKYKCVFQAGSQQRSGTYCRVGCEQVRNGAIGKVKTVLMRNLESPWICDMPAQPCPQEIDWDMWCGQVAVRPYHQDIYAPRANPGWLSFRRYAGGEMTGWGAHSFDVVQWALGSDGSGPVELWVDKEPAYEELVFTESKPRSWGYEVCTKPRVHMKYACGAEVILQQGPDFGGIFIGEQGKVEINRGRFTSNPPEIAAEALKDQEVRTGTAIHIKNWIDCIISRDEPNAPIEVAHGSTVACHLGTLPAGWEGRQSGTRKPRPFQVTTRRIRCCTESSERVTKSRIWVSIAR